MYRKSLALFLGMVVAVAAPALAWAEEGAAKKGVKIGSSVPDFKLKDLDGNEHTLSQHEGKPVVLVFVSKNCPWVRGSDPHLSALADEYEAKGVVFYGIDPDRDNTAASIKEHNEANGVTYTVLRDERNEYADVLDAKQTPEVFIVDGEGKLVYHGAFDNRRRETEEGSENYVRMALDEVLDGKPVSTPHKKQWGCTIKRVG